MFNWFKSKTPKEQLIAGHIRKKYTRSDDGQWVLCESSVNSTDAEDIRALVREINKSINEPYEKLINKKPNYNFMRLAGGEW